MSKQAMPTSTNENPLPTTPTRAPVMAKTELPVATPAASSAHPAAQVPTAMPKKLFVANGETALLATIATATSTNPLSTLLVSRRVIENVSNTGKLN